MSKKVKVSKDFVLEAHKAACQSWKERIEKEVPELFDKPELEVGEWYSYENGTFIFCHQPLGDSYGFRFSDWCEGRWQTKYSLWPDKTLLRKATEEEVKEGLIKEAKRRGYLSADMIRDLSYDISRYVEGKTYKSFYLSPVDYSLWIGNGRERIQIFSEGKWAEILAAKEENTSIKASIESLSKKLEELRRQIGE